MHFYIFNFVHKRVKVHNLDKRIIRNFRNYQKLLENNAINTSVASNFWKPWDLRGERKRKKRKELNKFLKLPFATVT